MTEWLKENPQYAVWISSILMTILLFIAGFIFNHIAKILAKTEELANELNETQKTINTFNQTTNANLSKICSAEITFGERLTQLQRALVSTTMVIRRRKAETAEIREEGKRTQYQVGEIQTRLQTQKQLLEKHNQILKRRYPDELR